MSGAEFLNLAVQIGLGVLCLAFLITVVRIVVGPTLPDRILALDMLVLIGIGFITIIAVQTGYFLYLDVAIGLGLVGFLATVAFARYVLRAARHAAGEPDDAQETDR